MSYFRFSAAVSGLSCLLSVLVASAEEGAPTQPALPAEHVQFFENKVRPLLAEHCLDCHGSEDQSGDLRLDSLQGMRLGGESGDPAVVPGNPDESVLIWAINYESNEMPPEGKLSAQQIEILTRWVALGAPWPGADPNAPLRKREHFNEEDRQWWAIADRSPTSAAPLDAAGKAWSRTPIDEFIYQKMSDAGLTPAPEASKATLVRRLYLDVTGLPPNPEQVAEFLNDTTPDAYETLVDRLLASRGYAEHAARQWLDLVRYADSDGYRADGFRPNAWRYRDYVIKSFDEDKPYDRFVQEQIAGDEMFPDDLDAQAALGYLRQWVYEWNIRDAPTQWNTIMEDVTDTTADVFLGLGLQCAKCHNHKFDPLLQKDYFRLRAFFEPLMPRDVAWADPKAMAQHEAKLDKWKHATQDIREKIAAIEQPYRDKYRDVAIDRFPEDIQVIARKPSEKQSPYDKQLVYLVGRQVDFEYDRIVRFIKGEDKEKLVALRRELKAFEEQKPSPLPQIMAVTDVGRTAPPTLIPKRSTDSIEPGIPSILDEEPLPIPRSDSSATTQRRTALAKWITDPSNPLTSRVIANRIWQSHFGRGLAANTSDLGRLGGPPTHPELLDWMACQLIEDGWSMKSLHRRILLSAVYRQSATHPRSPEYQEIDPANEYYWRRSTMRLSAEQIRDSLLAVSGKLKQRTGGSSQHADSPYRSVYTRMMRNSPDPLLASFDMPLFFSSTSSRNTTTTPIQSLLMFNSDLLQSYARTLAATVSRQASDLPNRIEVCFQRVYGRPPTSEEAAASLDFTVEQTEYLESLERKRNAESIAIETSKLPYRDGQAVRFDIKDPSLHLSIADDEQFDTGDFTIETFFQIRSIASSGAVRTIVAKWNPQKNPVGWKFGVTGKGSRRKPQTLVLHAVGKLIGGRTGEAAIFSDQHIEINTPYYASASVSLAKKGEPGKVTFFLKNLSNDDEPLLKAEISHRLAGGLENDSPLTFGRVSGRSPSGFDGLVDDVRWVGRAIAVDEILQTVERKIPDTIGYWRFEVDPGVMKNSVADTHPITARGASIISLSPAESALVDFCHALLNSNEFLYVD